jgi:hypothetical protein
LLHFHLRIGLLENNKQAAEAEIISQSRLKARFWCRRELLDDGGLSNAHAAQLVRESALANFALLKSKWSAAERERWRCTGERDLGHSSGKEQRRRQVFRPGMRKEAVINFAREN